MYAGFNFSIVKTTGYVIYPGVTWDSLPCFIVALSLFIIIFGLWHLLAWCTYLKTVRFFKKDDRYFNEEVISWHDQEKPEEHFV